MNHDVNHRTATFVLFVNGQRVCAVGVGANDTCGVHLSWIGGEPDVLLVTHVGGVMGGEEVRWELPELHAGDEITIRLADGAETTPPSTRRPYERMDRSAE